jgi:hypothetical protein
MVLLSWFIYGVLVIRAVIKGKLRTRLAQELWLQTGLCLAVLTLQGREIERQIDRHFGNYPVTLYLKSLLLLTVLFLFFRILHRSVEVTKQRHHAQALSLVTLFVSIFAGIIFVRAPNFHPDVLHRIIITLRDCIAILLIMAVLVPTLNIFYEQEQNNVMRVKAVSAIVTLCSYVIMGLGALGETVLLIMEHPQALWLGKFSQLFILPLVLSFMFLLFPHRWIHLLFFPVRFTRLLRLYSIVQYIFHSTQSEMPKSVSWKQLVRFREIELSMYRMLMAILDGYTLLPPESRLYQRINHVIKTERDYQRLIMQIAKIPS